MKNIVMLILIGKIQEKIGRGDEVELGEGGSCGRQGTEAGSSADSMWEVREHTHGYPGEPVQSAWSLPSRNLIAAL